MKKTKNSNLKTRCYVLTTKQIAFIDKKAKEKDLNKSVIVRLLIAKAIKEAK